jgi:hypothetical protein
MMIQIPSCDRSSPSGMDQMLGNKNVSAINYTHYAWHATPSFEIKHHHLHIFSHRLDD